jgi:hypothetical protein
MDPFRCPECLLYRSIVDILRETTFQDIKDNLGVNASWLRFVDNETRKSCQPPTVMPNCWAAGLTYRFSALPGLTGVPAPDWIIHSLLANCVCKT